MNAAVLVAQAVPAAPGGENLLLWGVLLALAAFVLLTLELFLPSGGMLGVAAALTAIAALGCFFAESVALGFAALLGLAVVTPVLLGVGLKIWPHTPVGRRLVLGGEEAEPAEQADAAAPSGLPRVGDRGESVTPLRRVGACRLNGKRVECLAESGMIDAGKAVVVSRVSGNEVFVREAEGKRGREKESEKARTSRKRPEPPRAPAASC